MTLYMWWSATRLGEKLPFARDRLVEIFLWAVALKFEPESGYCRRILTRVAILITVIDDIYDVYGTLDELELFEDALKRWDITDLDRLPHYMKICFIATFNVVNEIAFDVLKEHGVLIIKYLKKMWTDICKCYMVEAKWYYGGYTPTLQEYMDNGWISITAPLNLVHLYCLMTNPITEEAMECLVEYPSIIRQSGILVRLVDDLGTSSYELKRGDNPKSIQCYMRESGVSENDARRHIKSLISETWKQMNEDRFAKSPFCQAFIETAINSVRMSMMIYQHGDGFGADQVQYTKDQILSLFFNPIPLPEHENQDH
ncbi:Squalene/phytoene synthase [Trema orientale]|uniref:Squalene/phytoene synthase n=1 Tax=Trema orientale TaxID=63057 RepID=A0A2P5F9K3_TREOI|nr:Squalene/phytoene synthase [Trema orientale]